jgi:hypothetical protein
MAQGESVIQVELKGLREVPAIFKRAPLSQRMPCQPRVFWRCGFFVIEFSVTFEGKAVGQAPGAHSPLSTEKIFEQHRCPRCISLQKEYQVERIS